MVFGEQYPSPPNIFIAHQNSHMLFNFIAKIPFVGRVRPHVILALHPAVEKFFYDCQMQVVTGRAGFEILIELRPNSHILTVVIKEVDVTGVTTIDFKIGNIDPALAKADGGKIRV